MSLRNNKNQNFSMPTMTKEHSQDRIFLGKTTNMRIITIIIIIVITIGMKTKDKTKTSAISEILTKSTNIRVMNFIILTFYCRKYKFCEQ